MSTPRKRRRPKPAVEPFDLDVCGVTGDPGCLDCCAGYCEGLQFGVVVTYRRCTECDADDVYGELTHEDSCSLAPKASDAKRTGGAA